MILPSYWYSCRVNVAEDVSRLVGGSILSRIVQICKSNECIINMSSRYVAQYASHLPFFLLLLFLLALLLPVLLLLFLPDFFFPVFTSSRAVVSFSGSTGPCSGTEFGLHISRLHYSYLNFKISSKWLLFLIGSSEIPKLVLHLVG